MVTVLSCDRVREIDQAAIQQLKIPGIVLMENAARGVVDCLLRIDTPRRVVIACGPGNNGGDGFAIARHLDLQGTEVHVLVCVPREKVRGDAAANLAWLEESHVQLHDLQDGRWEEATWLRSLEQRDWAIDALLGTGSKGAPRPPLDRVIQVLNQLPTRRLAVDLPSGLDGETGKASDVTFRAQRTITLLATKPGLVTAEASAYVGHLQVAGIGVPRKLLERFGLSAPGTEDVS